jgi:sec-independent protein translocase protein TatA
MGSLGPFEIILIFLVILLVFGAKRIPEIARGLGKGIREFKSATTEIRNELTVDTNQIRPAQPPSQSTPRADSLQQQKQPVENQPQAEKTSAGDQSDAAS